MRFIQIGFDELVAVEHIVRVTPCTDVRGAVTAIDLSTGMRAFTALSVPQVLTLTGAELGSLTDRGFALYPGAEPTERYPA